MLIKDKIKENFALSLTIFLVLLTALVRMFSPYGHKWIVVPIIVVMLLWHIYLIIIPRGEFKGISDTIIGLLKVGFVHLVYISVWIICIILISMTPR